MVRALLSAIWIKDWGKSIVSMDPIRDLRILQFKRITYVSLLNGKVRSFRSFRRM